MKNVNLMYSIKVFDGLYVLFGIYDHRSWLSFSISVNEPWCYFDLRIGRLYFEISPLPF